MNNERIRIILNDCQAELDAIDQLIASLELFDPQIKFLTRYALIKACGTLELCYKSLIGDKVTVGASPEIHEYIQTKLVSSSRNPSHAAIQDTLEEFSDIWKGRYVAAVNALHDKTRIIEALKSLKDGRNEFAHGGSPMISFQSVRQYFIDSRRLIDELDRALG